MTSISRRQLLQGAGSLSLAGLAGTASAAGFASAPKSWDKKCDVVVLGAGGAGLHAAIQAADAGGKVILVNKSLNSHFSATALCGGLFAAFNSKKQRAEGIHDSIDEFVEDVLSYGGNWANPELLRTFATYSGVVFDWMMDHGLKPNKYENYLEHRNRRAARQDSYTGQDYIAVLAPEAEKRSAIQRHDNCAVTRFFYDMKNNRVTGVEVEDLEENKKFTIEARKGVVMATGGFIGSVPMVDRWVPSLQKTGVVLNTPANDGAALMTAVRDLGTPLTHMQFVVGYPNGVLEDEKTRRGTVCRFWYFIPEGGILVSKKGERFVNETIGVCHITPSLATLPGRRHYCLVTEEMWNEVLRKYPAGAFGWDAERLAKELKQGGIVFKADSIEALAKSAGINADGLKKELAAWNSAVEAERDPRFGRTKGMSRKIEKGPFYLITLSTYTIISSGGLRCNKNMQVLRWDDQPIGGLYAAGETVGAIHGNSYCGGCANGFAQTSGWVAGRLVMGASLPKVPDRC